MTLVVETIDGQFRVRPEEEFTFGRSEHCTFRVDDTDRNISREAGRISFNGEHWMLANTSSNRTLHLMDRRSGSTHTLMPGHAHAICEERMTVVMHGTNRSAFQFTVITPHLDAARRGDSQTSDSSATLGPPSLSPRQRRDLGILFTQYFEPDGQHAPTPLTYAQAAAFIGDTGKALEHRVSNFRSTLLKSGYPKMSLPELAIFLIGARVLAPEDFRDPSL